MIRAFLATGNRLIDIALARMTEARLARLDADVSSRMAASAYTAARAAKVDRVDIGMLLSDFWDDT